MTPVLAAFVRAVAASLRRRAADRFGVRRSKAGAGMSQETLAAEAGVNRIYVGMVERAERNITVLKLAQIAQALGVTASSLLAEAEKSRR